MLQHYFQRIVPEHIGREANDRWIVAFRVPGLQGAQYFIARHRVNPDARRRHFAQNFGRRARLHCKSCLHARCARDELDVRYPLPQQGGIIQPIWGADGVRQTMQKFRRMTHEKKSPPLPLAGESCKCSWRGHAFTLKRKLSPHSSTPGHDLSRNGAPCESRGHGLGDFWEGVVRRAGTPLWTRGPPHRWRASVSDSARRLRARPVRRGRVPRAPALRQ